MLWCVGVFADALLGPAVRLSSNFAWRSTGSTRSTWAAGASRACLARFPRESKNKRQGQEESGTWSIHTLWILRFHAKCILRVAWKPWKQIHKMHTTCSSLCVKMSYVMCLNVGVFRKRMVKSKWHRSGGKWNSVRKLCVFQTCFMKMCQKGLKMLENMPREISALTVSDCFRLFHFDFILFWDFSGFPFFVWFNFARPSLFHLSPDSSIFFLIISTCCRTVCHGPSAHVCSYRSDVRFRHLSAH